MSEFHFELKHRKRNRKHNNKKQISCLEKYMILNVDNTP